ncbi:MAG TPA: paraquat-inducible membrane protein A [Gammaproteobacteria bacterium]|nr:paraquat-inducible membrane protein A [Gammaproteobacteria bacterium]
MTQAGSALSVSMTGCHTCNQVVRIGKNSHHQGLRCPRCGTKLHPRIHNSLLLTWMLVCLAFVLYIPANVLPMTRVVALGQAQEDTIMSGVIYFIQHGSWYIGLVIFIASVFVPMLKLAMLMFLLISVQRKSQWRPRERTRIYRITELVGRWSMLDIYVVTILIALVSLGVFADIDVGPAAIFFAGVVVLTIFAAKSFDPRLIWDNIETEQSSLPPEEQGVKYIDR